MAFDNVTLFGLTVDTDRLARRLRGAPEPEPEPARRGRLARLVVASLVVSLVATGAAALWRRRDRRDATAIEIDGADAVETEA